MVDLKATPFHLDDEACRWVHETLAGLSEQEKIGQLFCEILWDRDDIDVDDLFRTISPGAVMYRPFSGKRMNELSRAIQDRSRVPMLIACNLERGARGGNGGLTDGTYVASPMGLAATDDPVHAYRTGLVSGREGAAAGINWTFGPIVDIDRNPANPITNVRTYGSDVDRIIAMAGAYIDGCTESGMATTLKHFPGDGIDYRDQHLMASVNDLPADDWRSSFGVIYQTLIDHGAGAVMSAHIKQPALTREINPAIADADIMPASLSVELNEGVLRRRMGFNGVILTDATQMAGFTSARSRAEAVPAAIANGCDMFLFTVNHDEDIRHMTEGVRSGVISPERLDEAVTRILALKASVDLHVKRRDGGLVPPSSALEILQCDEHLRWAQECADQAVTLVKDRDGLLPLSPQRHRRIAVVSITNESGGDGHPAEVEQLVQALADEGFAVEHLDPARQPGVDVSVEQFRAEVDLVVYYANMMVSSNQTTIRIIWDDFLGSGAPKFVEDVPALFLSFSNPYHLVDVPMVQTYVNAYSATAQTVDAVVEKLMGRSPFVGRSPVDPFAGLWDARL